VMAELFGVPAMLLNDDRLGRALEALAPVAEHVRGQLALAAAARGGADLSRLHLDLTAVRFAGAHEDSALVAKGWAADRTIKEQVRTLQASTPDGIAVYFRPHPGSRSELPCFVDAMERLQAPAPPGLVVVADSGLGYLATLCAAQRAGMRFVVPLRADTGWAKAFTADLGGLDQLEDLGYCSQREQRLPPAQRTAWRGLLRPYPAIDPETKARHDLRVAYIWSSEEAASVRAGRERALDKAEAALAKVSNGLGGRYYKTKKDLDAKLAQILGKHTAGLIHATTGADPDTGKPTLEWRRDHQAITAAGRLDGLYALAANLDDPPGQPLTAHDVLRLYKDQWIVEQRHRDLKQTIRVRPMFLHNDDRIAALVAVIGIALLVFGLIEADLRRALGPHARLPGLLAEGRAAKPTGRNILTAFAGLHLTYTPNGPVLDKLTPTQRVILAHLDIPLPWPEKTN
jgi:transposase